MPRYKPCGGGITARARRNSPSCAKYAVSCAAQHLVLQIGRHRVACDLPASIGMSMRESLDQYLVAEAISAGATFNDGSAVRAIEQDGAVLRVATDGLVASARYVIGADGANGVTARLAGFPSAIERGTAIEAEIMVDDSARGKYDQSALLDFAAVAGGYAWIFGKSDHLSVGVYTIDAAARRDLRPALATFLSGNEDLCKGTVMLQRGHRVPLAGDRASRVLGNVLLAGDAAALADPLTGEGISYAVASGRRAAATVLAALAAGPNMLSSYDDYLRDDLTKDLKFAGIVAGIAYRFPRFGLQLTEDHPGMQSLVAAVISGTEDYRTLAGRLISRSPKLLRYIM
ncbi:MAG: geranylgeranyl reductase [Chloroflexi bacterium]|nr:geranylgeranyl reductase [Chloroflexota bacterium]